MRHSLGYVVVADGGVPTRPVPVVGFSRQDYRSDEYFIYVIDQHSTPHDFITQCTEAEARGGARALMAKILAASNEEIITPASLSKDIEDILSQKIAEAAE